ncbi:MAG TPA: hypothetical protein VIV11_40055 [Kofleriaceae bacterium]
MRACLLWLVVVLVACGGKQPAPAPVSNTEPAKPAEQTAGAGEARVLQRTQAGGVIELAGDRGAAMEAANAEMNKHCGANAYTIVQEGEEAVGAPGGGMAVAWRVHYQCNH